MRPANAIDFWRGVALLMIFINHVPGNAFSYFTLRNFSLVDAADVFVFLAGWSLFLATGGSAKPESWRRVTYRLINRAIELYRAHIVISIMALAICAATALVRNNPIYLEWINAGPAFADPARAVVNLVLLTYQVGYFNILPLYVVLLLIMVPFILVARVSAALALGLSVTLYVIVLWTRIIPPGWPAYERWYFNPFAWQLVMVLGYLAAQHASSAVLEAWMRRMMPLALLLLAVGVVVTRLQLFPDPVQVPEPRLFFVFDKTYQSPARVISLVALAVAFRSIFLYLDLWLRAVVEYMCALGRNSLAVFSVGSLLSLVGQIIRFVNQGSFLVDLGIVACGIGLMGLTAWFVEWRDRLPPELSRSRSS